MIDRPQSAEKTLSALITADLAFLVIIDERAKIDDSRSQKSWCAGRPYEHLMEVAQLFDVPHIAYFEASNQQKPPDELPSPTISKDVIVSTHIDPWREPLFEKAVDEIGRSNLLVSGYCTQGAVTFAVLNALARGYETGYIADAASRSPSTEVSLATMRMIQAGAIPLSWRQLALEWQGDWAQSDTRERVAQLITC